MANAGRLLAALLVVVAAALITLGEADCSPWSVKSDPIEQLNERLVALTDSADLAANVEAARKYSKQAEFLGHKDVEFKLAVNRFSELNVNDVCERENFDVFRRLLELASRKSLENIRAAGDGPRVIRLLHGLLREFTSACFARLERAWSDRYGRRKYFEATKAPLIHLGLLLESRAEGSGLKRAQAEVRQLSGAVQLEKRRKAMKTARGLFAGEEVKRVLAAINEQQTGARALKLEANEALQEYLLEPCRRLMEEPTAIERVLKPMFIIASIGPAEELAKQPARFHAAGWAARYAACDLLLQANYGNQLAAEVAKAR